MHRSRKADPSRDISDSPAGRAGHILEAHVTVNETASCQVPGSEMLAVTSRRSPVLELRLNAELLRTGFSVG